MRQLFAWTSIVAAAAFSAGTAHAGHLAYVEASTELDDGKPRSYAYNLIDGKDTTAWCSKPDPGQETLVFGFTGKEKVTHIGIVVGAIHSGELDKRRKRVKMLYVSDGNVRREIPFKDKPGLQEIKLDPVVNAQRVLIDIAEVYEGTDGTAPVCIGDIVLKSGKRELTGQSIYKTVRSLNTPSRRLLHTWVDEPSAPERTLNFALDGTFTYNFEPLMEGKAAKLRGKWSTAGSWLTLETRGKSYKLKVRRTEIDEGDQKVTQIQLSGDAPDPSLNAAFLIAPARYE